MGKCEWCGKETPTLWPLYQRKGIRLMIFQLCKACFEKHGGGK
jgi:hypothetical protein